MIHHAGKFRNRFFPIIFFLPLSWRSVFEGTPMMTLSCTQKTRCDRLTAAPRTSPAWGRSWAPPRAGGFGGAVAAGPPVSGKAYSCQAVTVLQRLAFTVIADTTELDQWSAAVPFPGPGRLSASPPGVSRGHSVTRYAGSSALVRWGGLLGTFTL